MNVKVKKKNKFIGDSTATYIEHKNITNNE